MGSYTPTHVTQTTASAVLAQGKGELYALIGSHFDNVETVLGNLRSGTTATAPIVLRISEHLTPMIDMRIPFENGLFYEKVGTPNWNGEAFTIVTYNPRG